MMRGFFSNRNVILIEVPSFFSANFTTTQYAIEKKGEVSTCVNCPLCNANHLFKKQNKMKTQATPQA